MAALPPLREENLAMDLLNAGDPFEEMDLSAQIDVSELTLVNQSRALKVKASTLKLGNLILVFALNPAGVSGLVS